MGRRRVWGLARRVPFSLPFHDQIPILAAVLLGGEEEITDADRFIEAAGYHNVAGSVVGAAREGRLSLDASHLRLLADRHLRRVARTRMLHSELAHIGPSLREACGVHPVVVKGPAVAERFYGDRRDRPYSDLDLLLPREGLSVAVTTLALQGYEVREEFRPGYAERFGHDVHLARHAGSDSVDVELHWRLGDDAVGLPLDYAWVAASAERLDVAGATVLVPAVAEQLLLLSVHLLSDRARRLAWVNDIRLVAEAAGDTTWEQAFRAADQLGGGLLWVLNRALDYAGRHLSLDRPRPIGPGSPPPFGPLRAVEELDLQAAPHVGRLVALRGRERLAYLHAVAVPTRAGLEGTVGGDGASLPALVARHLVRAVRGAAAPRTR